MALLSSTSPVSIGGLPINNPLANPNTFTPKVVNWQSNISSTPDSNRLAPLKPPAPNNNTNLSTTPVSTAPTFTPQQLQAQTDFATGDANAHNLINTGISGAAQGYQGSILDYLTGAKQQQNTINSERTQDQLAKMVGTAGVLSMVSHGIRSGGVTLANDNAANSSAGDALARAYAQLGREQLSGVGNQFAQAELKPTTDQTNLDMANSDEVRHASLDKTTAINNIVNDASQKLGALNQMAMYASIPDRINIDQEIQQIKSQALSALTAFDQTLSSGIASNTPLDQAGAMSAASSLRQAGTAPDNAFQTTTSIPAQFQNTGPFASDLPLFTLQNGKKQTA